MNVHKSYFNWLGQELRPGSVVTTQTSSHYWGQRVGVIKELLSDNSHRVRARVVWVWDSERHNEVLPGVGQAGRLTLIDPRSLAPSLANDVDRVSREILDKKP